MQPCAVLAWQVEIFQALMESFPAFRRNVLGVLQERLHELEHRFSEIITKNVEARLSNELIRLSERFGKPIDGHSEVYFSQKELAQLTATTPCTVSRLLGNWQRRGVVSLRKGVVRIRDLAALTQIALSG